MSPNDVRCEEGWPASSGPAAIASCRRRWAVRSPARVTSPSRPRPRRPTTKATSSPGSISGGHDDDAGRAARDEPGCRPHPLEDRHGLPRARRRPVASTRAERYAGMDPSPCRRNSRVAGAVFLRHDGRECTACRIGFIGCSGCSTISTLINQFSYESFDLRVTAPTPNIFLSASIDLN
jgi:hypothetical protein